MRQDEMIKLAREAGFDDDNQFTIYNIERFATIVAAHEREACAKVCEETELPFDIDLWHNSTKKEMTAHTAHGLAAAIRARGE